MGYERYCSECKKEINRYARSDVETCSATCRKRRERRQDKARRAFPLAMYELGKIRESLKHRERVPDFIAELQRLKAEINDLLVLAGEPESMARLKMLEDRAIHGGGQ
jgi:hypothetical protein